ncbi:OsmC family protein [Oceanotoga sp. DSM 15011]|uniref:Redox protein n=1 Tax=Oceanotoga teriensis TaxID=515440 RepID=A0AA45C8F4_9BACT|nr:MULTISPECIES: OsmC family protein [Oceanotoga]MDO7977870.1 OsmC family protein [Oceanotoga teriensis]PWJ96009.1 putative redox protein [Oceanotoga teriensis]UYP00769.1 OsmC family protein [Oceanotoga sp. DSM 15011]
MKKYYEFKEISPRHFYSRTASEHDIHVDAGKEIGGGDTAARPFEYLMTGLAGCSGIDVSMILEKMKVEYEEFNIKIDADRRDEDPGIFETIHMVYEFKGDNLPIDKLERAVKLSQEKYCGAAAIFKASAKLTYEIKVIN